LRHVLTCPCARGSTLGTTCHSVRPRGPHIPTAGTVESIPSGSGEAEPVPSGSGRVGQAGLLSQGSDEAEPVLLWSDKVARALLLGLIFGLSVPFLSVGHPWPCNSFD
jgi:hypothetical protein